MATAKNELAKLLAAIGGLGVPGGLGPSLPGAGLPEIPGAGPPVAGGGIPPGLAGPPPVNPLEAALGNAISSPADIGPRKGLETEYDDIIDSHRLSQGKPLPGAGIPDPGPLSFNNQDSNDELFRLLKDPRVNDPGAQEFVDRAETESLQGVITPETQQELKRLYRKFYVFSPER